MEILEMIRNAERKLSPLFQKIEETALFNQEKVLSAFRAERIAARHFNPSTGYGYGDEGKEALGKVFARAFCAERAIVSPALLSGTHTLTVGLFGLLRPKMKMLILTGTPYDTIRQVLRGKGNGSLCDFDISCEVLPLKDGKIDLSGAEEKLKEGFDLVYLQRSRGYELRNAFTIDALEEAIKTVRKRFSGCIFVDNCYGEFVETREPLEAGADVIAGSLIKNPGGGLAPTGGYLAGKEEYLSKIENRLTAPSVGTEIGSYAYGYLPYFQGFFLSPHVVEQALKGSLLLGECLSALGFETFPKIGEPLGDITRAVRFSTKEELLSFIQTVQEFSPVDSFVKLEPWDMPGYDSKVVMAAGTFVSGGSVELSADAPIRPPYTAYFQGGLSFEHVKIVVKEAMSKFTKILR